MNQNLNFQYKETKMNVKELDKIYVLHYPKLKERRDYLEKKLNDLGLKNHTVWVLSRDNDTYSDKDLKLYDKRESAFKERQKILGSKIPPIKKIDIIMMHEHIRVFKKIVSRKNNKFSVILEDDALLVEDFPKKLEETFEKLSKLKWDVCYSDQGSLFSEPKIKGNNEKGIFLYKQPTRRSNTTGSYILNRTGTKKLLKLMKKVAAGPDMELGYVQRKHKFNVYWTIPFLTHQGSIEFVYHSNIRGDSITGALFRMNRKLKKFSPAFADSISRLVDNIMVIVYKSDFLIKVKNLIKKIMRY